MQFLSVFPDKTKIVFDADSVNADSIRNQAVCHIIYIFSASLLGKP